MTALVVSVMLVCLMVTVFGVVIAHVRSIRVKDLADIIRVQSDLIMDIEEKAMNYGYTEPLAYDIIQTIRETRRSLHKKENS